MSLARPLLLLLSLFTPAIAVTADFVVVRNSAELVAALTPGNAGRKIRLAPGEYAITAPLVVPDRVVLQGEGTMRLDDEGRPEGLDPATSPTLRAGPGIVGDFVTLGHLAALERVRIEDVAGDPSTTPGRSGNTVALYSRQARDSVAATITDCEIVNPNGVGSAAGGPTRHAVVVVTRGSGTGAPAHEAAKVSLRIRRSLVSAPRGHALFISNFAAASQVEVQVESSLLEGTTTVVGGTSRSDSVTQATTVFRSRVNLYVQDEIPRVPAWQLIGGSSDADPSASTTRGAVGNILRVESAGDRIEAAGAAIHASGGRRERGTSGPSSGNVALIGLSGTTLLTANDGADLILEGARSGPGSGNDQEFRPGDGNILRISIDGARGSGARANQYRHVSGPQGTAKPGSGNRLEFVGRHADFLNSNPGVTPAPGPEFFPADRSRK